METKTSEALRLLREMLQREHMDAIVIPSCDPHGSEYVSEYWKAREHFSGFTGSAGTLVVLAEKAALWTDSRYYLQAESELHGSGIELMKTGLAGTPDLVHWLKSEVRSGGIVNLPGSLFSISDCQAATAVLKEQKIDFRDGLIDDCWPGRPAKPESKAFAYGEEYSGKSATEKINTLREQMSRMGIDTLLLSHLDEIGWLCNIRGNEIRHTPVISGYMIVEKSRVRLYLTPSSHKGNAALETHLENQGIELRDYDDFGADIAGLEKRRILLDKDRDNYAIFKTVAEKNRVFFGRSPVAMAKAIRNTTEIRNVRKAMEKDGRALVRFWKWMEAALDHGEPLSELSVAEKLREFREKESGFREESFESIVGYGAHGAIVHYRSTEASNAEIKKGNLLLIDSGGQYAEGTTDITRTFALGDIGEEARHDYTLVLKGLIALSSAYFPAGSSGSQIDLLAKQYLWKEGKSYGHGTGHGVGHFLCVHEGPQNISPKGSYGFRAGMVTSNEPGYYLEGRYGIRHENLTLTRLVTEESEDEEFAPEHPIASSNVPFLRFETLTLCPFDVNGIEFALLTEAECDWLNRYHRMVMRRLGPHLEEREAEWLRHKTLPINRKGICDEQ